MTTPLSLLREPFVYLDEDRLRSFFPTDDIREDDLLACIHSPLFDGILSLSLPPAHSSPPVLCALASSPYASNLRRLEFSFCDFFSPEGLEALSLSSSLPSLRTLVFEDCGFHPPALAALAHPQSTLLPRLHALYLNDASLDPSTSALLLACNFSSLASLYFQSNHPGAEGISALVQNPTLKNLKDLSLNYCGLRDPEIETLSSSSSFPSLYHLGLEGNLFRIYPDRPLFFPPSRFPSLRRLELEDPEYDDIEYDDIDDPQDDSPDASSPAS